MRIPTVKQVGRLVVNADSRRVSTRKGFRAYVALCAFAGLRTAEAAAVQVGDIDFLRRQLTISRQLQRDGSGYAIRPPKYGSEGSSICPTSWSSSSASMSQPTSVRASQTGGCSPLEMTLSTTTRSPGGGGRPATPPSSRTSGSTTCGTSTRLA